MTLRRGWPVLRSRPQRPWEAVSIFIHFFFSRKMRLFCCERAEVGHRGTACEGPVMCSAYEVRPESQKPPLHLSPVPPPSAEVNRKPSSTKSTPRIKGLKGGGFGGWGGSHGSPTAMTRAPPESLPTPKSVRGIEHSNFFH